MSEKTFGDFEEFWPYFLSSHRHPGTRWAHVAIVAVVARGIVKSASKHSSKPLLGSVAVAGALAMLSHRFIEGNSPKFMGQPLWAARGLARLVTRTITNRISEDLANLPKAT